jgi:hypothetical protein
MKEWNLKDLWDEVKKAFQGAPGDNDEKQRQTSIDPSLQYHLMFTIPVVLGLLLLSTRRA